jgi:hypothetical protein
MTDLSLGQEFGTIFIAFRSFQALLTRTAQRKCLQACARHLRRGGLLGIDVFNTNLPRLLQPGGVEEPPDELTGPDGTRITLTAHTDYDLPDQSLRSIWRHEYTDAGGRVQRREHVIDLHYFFRCEFEWMLEACGFEVEALYGDFDRRPFAADSPEMIFVARGV